MIAESLLAAGTPVVALTPKASALEKIEGRDGVIEVFRSPSPDRKRLFAHLTAVDGPLVVLVDDAEALYGQPVEELLAERGRRPRPRQGARGCRDHR